MFTLHGYIQGVAYHLTVSEGAEPKGTDNALDLVASYENQQVKATPTGPILIVERTDPASLYALFSTHTQITSVDGQPPVLHEPEEPGVTY